MKNRALKITFIIVLIIAIIFLVFWLLARNTAKKQGSAQPTFKEFFTFTTPGSKGGTNPGELSGTFTDGTNEQTSGSTNNTTGEGSTGGESGGGTLFTNGTITPVGDTTPITVGPNASNNSTGVTSGPGITTNPGTSPGSYEPPTGTTGPGTTEPPFTNPISTVPPGASGGDLQCSDADTHIKFTQAELDRLQILQQRFNTIAAYLHTDGDLAIVEANYDSYKVKGAQATELAAYCENTTPKLAASDLNHRTPTPFWHDLSLDDNIFGVFFFRDNVPYKFTLPSDYTKEHTDDDHHRGVLEHALGISIW